MVLDYWLLKKNNDGLAYHNTPRDNNNNKKNCCCYNANYTASGYINGCNIIMLNPLLKKKTPLHFARKFSRFDCKSFTTLRARRLSETQKKLKEKAFFKTIIGRKHSPFDQPLSVSYKKR